MNGVMKRLLIILILGAVGAAGIYMARKSYEAPPDNYQNGTPPVGANAKPDHRFSDKEEKDYLKTRPGAAIGG